LLLLLMLLLLLLLLLSSPSPSSWHPQPFVFFSERVICMVNTSVHACLHVSARLRECVSRAVYDVANKGSFESVPTWLSKARSRRPPNSPPLQGVLVANKVDGLVD